jgi:hypothetical protein
MDQRDVALHAVVVAALGYASSDYYIDRVQGSPGAYDDAQMELRTDELEAAVRALAALLPVVSTQK